AMTAVFAPAPKRGRIAAYTHSTPMPVTKSSSTNHGTRLSIAPGCLPSACMAAAISCFIITPKNTKSTMFSTTPARSPPTTTRPQLILPITHLVGQPNPHGEEPRARQTLVRVREVTAAAQLQRHAGRREVLHERAPGALRGQGRRGAPSDPQRHDRSPAVERGRQARVREPIGRKPRGLDAELDLRPLPPRPWPPFGMPPGAGAGVQRRDGKIA